MKAFQPREAGSVDPHRDVESRASPVHGILEERQHHADDSRHRGRSNEDPVVIHGVPRQSDELRDEVCGPKETIGGYDDTDDNEEPARESVQPRLATSRLFAGATPTGKCETASRVPLGRAASPIGNAV